jgi:hypothetical protein
MTAASNDTDLQANLLEIYRTKGLDWCLREIKKSIPPETCLCGKPLFERCHYSCGIKINEYQSDIMPAFVPQALSDIRIDNTFSPSKPCINYAHVVEWISDWEWMFAHDVFTKETNDGLKLSEKQLATRVKINKKILAAFDLLIISNSNAQ